MPKLYSPAAITPMVAGPSGISKAMDFTFPSKYSFVLNMVGSGYWGLVIGKLTFVIIFGHSWSFVVIHGHLWSIVVIHGHSVVIEWSIGGHRGNLLQCDGHSNL